MGHAANDQGTIIASVTSLVPAAPPEWVACLVSDSGSAARILSWLLSPMETPAPSQKHIPSVIDAYLTNER